jgi:hypothetical protein
VGYTLKRIRESAITYSILIEKKVVVYESKSVPILGTYHILSLFHCCCHQTFMNGIEILGIFIRSRYHDIVDLLECVFL